MTNQQFGTLTCVIIIMTGACFEFHLMFVGVAMIFVSIGMFATLFSNL